MKPTLLFILITTFLTGCVPIPKIHENNKITIKEIGEKNIYSLTNIAPIVNRYKWWEQYNDSQLNSFIETTLKNNSTIKIAQLNIDKSNELLGLAKNTNEPNLNFNANLDRERLSGTGFTPPPYAGQVITLGQIGLNSSYSLDYLNKNNNLINEEINKNDGLIYKKMDLELTITTQFVKTYLYLQYLNKLEKIIIQEASVALNILQKTNKKVEIGLGTEEEILLNKNNVKLFENNLDSIEQNKKIALNLLEQLSNTKLKIEPSDSIWIDLTKYPVDTIDITSVQNKPNILYYLQTINAQEEHLESLKADFYPSIKISGSAGFQQINPADILTSKSFLWNFGPSISIPIFDSGKIKSTYKVAGVDLNIFIEQYNQEVFKSIQSINDNLFKTKTFWKNLNNQNNIFNNQEQIYSLSNEKFKLGKISELEFNYKKLDLLKNQENKLTSEFNYLNSDIELINSIGGNIKKQ